MASFTALKSSSRRPLSCLLTKTHKPSSSLSGVRCASIVPYTITATGPPAPPMTLEQVAQLQQRKQQTLLEEQIQRETSQRARQQQELWLQLAKNRNRILEQQKKEQERQAAATRDGGVETMETRTREEYEDTRDVEQETRRAVSTPQDEASREAGKPLHASTFVGTRRCSMFGYRGPETTEETLPMATPKQRRVLVAAEDRVKLAMMDYSAKEIDAMSPEQARTLLSSSITAKEELEEEKVHTFDDVISQPTSAPTTTSSSSVELELDSCLAKTTSSST
ncbi:hypothetical protein CPC16_009118 [Podila verticillata]|nr:hypothetical protein CPC16_009118 [Podila verticillata]KAI9237698.1 MAG: hypothetical protein BYD32DRAFT_436423 [Podila humilis]